MAKKIKRSPSGCPVGEAHHAAKLTEAKVRELRHLVHDKGLCHVCAQRLIAPEVSKQSAYEAIHSYTWKHVR